MSDQPKTLVVDIDGDFHGPFEEPESTKNFLFGCGFELKTTPRNAEYFLIFHQGKRVIAVIHEMPQVYHGMPVKSPALIPGFIPAQ